MCCFPIHSSFGQPPWGKSIHAVCLQTALRTKSQFRGLMLRRKRRKHSCIKEKLGGKGIHWETAMELCHMFECPVAALTVPSRREGAGRWASNGTSNQSRDGSSGEEQICLLFKTPLHHLFNSSLHTEFVLTLPVQGCYSSKARSKIWLAHAADLIHLLQWHCIP